mmetsp:Transcript_53942/g.144334  ORF Transcript_53942/g.144334 Transcript_53942/m.144334 type:complete len:93 (-) Transcript_53942:731-1009(-)
MCKRFTRECRGPCSSHTIGRNSDNALAPQHHNSLLWFKRQKKTLNSQRRLFKSLSEAPAHHWKNDGEKKERQNKRQKANITFPTHVKLCVFS